MSDREALAAALEVWLPRPGSYDDEQWEILCRRTDAARERLAQLPEKCGTCGGTGKVAGIKPGFFNPLLHFCPPCHGSGKVYPAELVELIWEAIRGADALVEIPFRISTAFGAVEVTFGVLNLDGPTTRDAAAAVLDALNGETE